MTDEKYTLEEIKEAIGRAAVQTDDFTSSPAQLIVEELTRPKHKFEASRAELAERQRDAALEALERVSPYFSWLKPELERIRGMK